MKHVQLVVNNDVRTNMIANDIVKELKDNRYPLIISERKEHLSNISCLRKQSFLSQCSKLNQ